MKVIKPCEVIECDFCGDSEAYYKCLGCGKDVCYECLHDRRKAVCYHLNCYSSGSGDGHYCLSCDKKLAKDKLHKAYIAVAKMKEKLDKENEKLTKERRRVERQLEILVNFGRKHG